MSTQTIFSRSEVVGNYQPRSWQHIVFKETEATLTSKSRLFPCLFGVAGFAPDQLRFGFSDTMSAPDVAAALRAYLPECRRFGKNTSLVMFSRPGPVASLKSYERRFWSLLRELAHIDDHDWPQHIPEQLNDAKWEFCFAGEPIFVVCNTPAHINRQSRRASCFMVTFQPRWVFDEIMATPELAARTTGKVRKRLEPFDLIAPSPVLGTYGEDNNREYQQYFLNDTNEAQTCPFHKLKPTNPTKKENAA
jgi:uncharacterized protein